MLNNLSSSNKMTPFIVALAMFMEGVDTTVINTAIPQMSLSLHVNPVDLKVALISYLLSLAIFIPISGWIADKYGVKKVFIAAISIFTFSSFFCGFSHNLTELVIARIFQGIGGSLMLPLGRYIIVRTYHKHELINIMNHIVMMGVLGILLGPVIGGIIVHYFIWRWIFWVNIPVGIINIYLAQRFLIKSPPETVPALDKIGFVLFGVGLAGITFGLSAISESTISLFTTLSIILAAICLFIIYWYHSRTQPHPIINIGLLKYRTFQTSFLGNLLGRLGFGGLSFLLPLLLQIGLGYSPQLSGFLLAPTALGVVIVKPISLYILRLLGYKKLLIINTVFVGLFLWIFSLVTINTSIYIIASLTLMFGFLSALQYTGMNSLAYAEIQPNQLSAATSIISTLQQVGQSFGVAVCAIFIQFFSGYSTQKSNITVTILHQTFIVMGVITFISILIFMRLKPEDGAELISPKSQLV